ncbi:Pr6Pr family membrane protein [Demequina sp. TTPB684]|uniref:Pr6Pr family membrane protein n=1 Tax=unclassified Demequina TaxID=2620311 RepID=UPI001CF5CC3C|nr:MULTISPECIES: Pr6Pr family membrane protein [unclassified Demequina]MCB2411739.1 Pr6Pr family membrane protein [Demequina sp. TTPB684]UPU87602.1 Pr6Pr family membrane protein [Demequina sp. TMPB413]
MSRHHSASTRWVATLRVAMSLLIVGALIATLTDNSGLVPSSYLDLLSYYTLQTNVAALIVWVVATVAASGMAQAPWWLEVGRAFVAANLVLIACVYWVQVAPLGLEHGPQLVTVMIISHVVTPLYMIAEHLLVGTRLPVPTRLLPWLVAYPMAWSAAAVIRVWSGGWVPYEYLEPSRGIGAVAVTIAAQGAVLCALTWAAMRLRAWRRVPDPAYRAETSPTSIEMARSDVSQRAFSLAASTDITPQSPKSSI